MSKIFEALKRSGGASDLGGVLPQDHAEQALQAEQAGDEPEEVQLVVDETLDLSLTDDFDLGPKSELRTVSIHLSPDTPLLPFAAGRSQAAEQYRIVRTKILQHPKQPRQMVVSSPEAGDGKSVNAVNLAGALALNPEVDVLLVDGDLHRSSLAGYFRVPSSPGLGEVLSGGAGLAEAVARVDSYPNLFFLPGGRGARASAELLDSSNARKLSEALSSQFNYVVIDAPPVGAVADFDLLMQNSDGVVLVVRQDHTNRLLCMKTIESIASDKLIGVMFNCVKPWFLGKTLGYYHYYHYHYSKYYGSRR